MTTGFVMPLLQGEPVSVDLPGLKDSRDSAMEMFGIACDAVAKELLVRINADAERHLWLQSVAYQLIGSMISHGFGSLFDERIRNHDRKLRSPEGALNPFQLGLFAIFVHRKKRLLNERDRHRFGIRLWYAYRHYVPQEFLRGFLHQVWTTGIDQRAAAGEIEPDFRVWVITHRAVDPVPSRRGFYPDDIEGELAGVKRVMKVLSSVAGT